MKSIKEQHQGRCVHYQREPGMPKREACKKGIVYDELTKNAELGRTGCALRLPCIRHNHNQEERKGHPLCECAHLQWPTEAESEAHQKEIIEHVKKIELAMELIAPIRKEQKGKDWSGTVTCPVCNKSLLVQHHGYNGHVWAQCETPGCVSWIE